MSRQSIRARHRTKTFAHRMMRWLAPLCLMLAPGSIGQSPLLTHLANDPALADSSPEELTRIIQVRNLPPKEAARRYPVRVTGVVTHNDPAHYLRFVQDDSAGIYVELGKTFDGSYPQAGEAIEIRGFTSPGEFAPMIVAEHIRAQGVRPLPPPRVTTLQALMTGTEDSQWVALRGVIRSQQVEDNHTVMLLSTPHGVIKATVPDAAKQPAPRDFVDSTVELHGVCTTVFNERRQLQGVELHIPTWDQVLVKESPPEAMALLPIRPIDGLLQFRPGMDSPHRAHVQGVLTLRHLDGSLFVQDSTGGVRVQPQDPIPLLRVGDPVDVFGFPSVAERMPVLQAATLRPLAEPVPVEPIHLQSEAALNDQYHAMLVCLEGRVISQNKHQGEETLTLQFGALVTDALLESSTTAPGLPRLAPGSIVRASGVYLARLDESRKVRSFQLFLRGPEDLIVIARPPWLTAARILWLLGTGATVLVFAFAWVASLRKKVHDRTRELREEMAERKRMEEQVEKTHRELLHTSRQAGMAEVATSVLHNVGNVLNSVNVSASLISDHIRQSKTTRLARVAKLLRDHSADLADFLTRDAQGRQITEYLEQLAQHAVEEQAALIDEVRSLSRNIDHIKDIVAMQQTYAKVCGVVETVIVAELVEDALRLNAGSLARHGVELVREYEPCLPEISVEKHKVLQILVNLIRNAKYACDESGRKDKRLTVRATNGEQSIKISVIDNGVGIAPQNLHRIFSHGFTTRRDGHGFGLHSGALTAKELGGSLRAQSDGPGRGATFMLELPLRSVEQAPAEHRLDKVPSMESS